eukprot:CAMPEP_0197002330 /NCGR_PEP_ID=MMETSP1380-20130617/6847_1 /TAXON_ID=5936 /ORGANISM="Euplotes crassus, Strain CT5" /LENGTH=111 /DNA_ID=CAMNT_0042420405 /DNA_START=1256 /DNA_END=1587 /DNA_ORIENTATION=+
MKEVNMIRAQLNEEFLNKQVPCSFMQSEKASSQIAPTPFSKVIPEPVKEVENSKIPDQTTSGFRRLQKESEIAAKHSESSVPLEEKIAPKTTSEIKTVQPETPPSNYQSFP